MKNKFQYLFPLLLILLAGCIKSYHDPASNSDNWGYPLGTFKGNFVRIHKNRTTYKYDTTRAELELVLSTNTGFMITGDTTLHAGSYGSFKEDYSNMMFWDVTNASPNKFAKAHLGGVFKYVYDGSYLEIKRQPITDTLQDTYYFTKQKK